MNFPDPNLNRGMPGPIPTGPIDPMQYNQGYKPNDYTYQEHLKGLESKWIEMRKEIEDLQKDPEKFKTQNLPLARIKKIMKSDEDVRMISAEAPVLFAKACEMFIMELTHRAWYHTEECKRRTLQRCDISQAISKTDIFDFLIDIIPREEEGFMGFPMGDYHSMPKMPNQFSLNMNPTGIDMESSLRVRDSSYEKGLISSDPNQVWTTNTPFTSKFKNTTQPPQQQEMPKTYKKEDDPGKKDYFNKDN